MCGYDHWECVSFNESVGKIGENSADVYIQQMESKLSGGVLSDIAKLYSSYTICQILEHDFAEIRSCKIVVRFYKIKPFFEVIKSILNISPNHYYNSIEGYICSRMGIIVDSVIEQYGREDEKEILNEVRHNYRSLLERLVVAIDIYERYAWVNLILYGGNIADLLDGIKEFIKSITQYDNNEEKQLEEIYIRLKHIMLGIYPHIEGFKNLRGRIQGAIFAVAKLYQMKFYIDNEEPIYELLCILSDRYIDEKQLNNCKFMQSKELKDILIATIIISIYYGDENESEEIIKDKMNIIFNNNNDMKKACILYWKLINGILKQGFNKKQLLEVINKEEDYKDCVFMAKENLNFNSENIKEIFKGALWCFYNNNSFIESTNYDGHEIMKTINAVLSGLYYGISEIPQEHKSFVNDEYKNNIHHIIDSLFRRRSSTLYL